MATAGARPGPGRRRRGRLGLGGGLDAAGAAGRRACRARRRPRPAPAAGRRSRRPGTRTRSRPAPTPFRRAASAAARDGTRQVARLGQVLGVGRPARQAGRGEEALEVVAHRARRRERREVGRPLRARLAGDGAAEGREQRGCRGPAPAPRPARGAAPGPHRPRGASPAGPGEARARRPRHADRARAAPIAARPRRRDRSRRALAAPPPSRPRTGRSGCEGRPRGARPPRAPPAAAGAGVPPAAAPPRAPAVRPRARAGCRSGGIETTAALAVPAQSPSASASPLDPALIGGNASPAEPPPRRRLESGRAKLALELPGAVAGEHRRASSALRADLDQQHGAVAAREPGPVRLPGEGDGDRGRPGEAASTAARELAGEDEQRHSGHLHRSPHPGARAHLERPREGARGEGGRSLSTRRPPVRSRSTRSRPSPGAPPRPPARAGRSEASAIAPASTAPSASVSE